MGSALFRVFVMAYVTLDIETFFDKDYSLAGRGKNAMTMEEYINDPRYKLHGVGIKEDNGKSKWLTKFEFESSLPELRKLFASSACIAHNAAFDMAALSWHYGIKFGLIIDTLSMARPVLGADASVSLSALATHFGVGEKGKELFDTKGIRDLSEEQLVVLGGYCCNDVDLTWAVFNELRKGFPKEEIAVIDTTIRMYSEPVLEADVDLLKAFHLKEIQDKQEFLNKLGSDKETLQSNDKFAQLLISLGVEPPMKYSEKQKKQVWAFAKSDPEFKMLLEHPNDLVSLAVEARLSVKSTLGETRSLRLIGVAERNAGKIPNPKKYCGAHTLRFSGAERLNLENLPRGSALRASIKAPKGFVLCAVDSANIEARVLPWFAGQQDLLEQFILQDKKLGLDVYSSMASKIYGREVDRKKYPERDFIPGFLGKAVVLGCGYGMGWTKFQGMIRAGMLGQSGITFDQSFVDTMGINVQRFVDTNSNYMRTMDCFREWDDKNTHITHCAVAKKIIDEYRASVPKIPELWGYLDSEILNAMHTGQEIIFGPNDIMRTGKNCIYTPSGFALHYPGLHKRESVKNGKVSHQWVYFGKGKKAIGTWGGSLTENIIQHLARLVITYQLTLVAKRYKVATTTHDEIVAVIPEDEAEEGCVWITEQMRQTKPWMLGLPINAEGNYGVTYKDCK